MKKLLFFAILTLPVSLMASDYFLYKFKGHQRVGDVLHKYNIGPLWGKNGHVAKTIQMNPDLMNNNGELYNSNVWVKLPIPQKEGWRLPNEVAGRLKHIGPNVVMNIDAFKQSEAEKALKELEVEQLKKKHSAAYIAVNKFNELQSLKWGQDPFLKPAGIRTVASVANDIELEYIDYDTDYPTAVLDGITVYEGSVTKKGSVIKIGLDFILLKNGSEIRQLVLSDNAEKAKK